MTYHETFNIENNTKILNPKKIFYFIENQARKMYNTNFKIQQDDIPTIYRLLIYAIKDQKRALELGLDLNKGIMLSGPIGCGKHRLCI